jgi:hypothetical protein
MPACFGMAGVYVLAVPGGPECVVNFDHSWKHLERFSVNYRVITNNGRLKKRKTKTSGCKLFVRYFGYSDF